MESRKRKKERRIRKEKEGMFFSHFEKEGEYERNPKYWKRRIQKWKVESIKINWKNDKKLGCKNILLPENKGIYRTDREENVKKI